MVSLCFGREGLYLGELWTEGGAFARWVPFASPNGSFEKAVDSWKSRGVPVHRSATRRDADGGREHTIFQVRVALHEPAFRGAVQAWGAGHDIALIDLDPKRLPYWQALVELPMDGRTRVALLLGIRSASAVQLKEHVALIEELQRVARATRMRVRARFAAPEPKP